MTNNEDRRKALENMYKEVINNIAQRVGGIKITGVAGNIIRENESLVFLRTHRDAELMVYWDHVIFHNNIDFIIKSIKDKQLYYYSKKSLNY